MKIYYFALLAFSSSIFANTDDIIKDHEERLSTIEKKLAETWVYVKENKEYAKMTHDLLSSDFNSRQYTNIDSVVYKYQSYLDLEIEYILMARDNGLILDISKISPLNSFIKNIQANKKAISVLPEFEGNFLSFMTFKNTECKYEPDKYSFTTKVKDKGNKRVLNTLIWESSPLYISIEYKNVYNFNKIEYQSIKNLPFPYYFSNKEIFYQGEKVDTDTYYICKAPLYYDNIIINNKAYHPLSKSL